MTHPWAYLDEQDRATYRTTVVFLRNRLTDEATIDWALRLKPTDRIQRLALEELLDRPSSHMPPEPWVSAWRLIEESWSAGTEGDGSSREIYSLQARLRAGDRSGATASAIVALVRPYLKVEPINALRREYVRSPRRPKAVEHLLSARLSSGELIDLHVLELDSIDDLWFLHALASRLETAVNKGLEIGRRTGWSENHSFLRLGILNRVYYTQNTRHGHVTEPDAYHRGIAPSVKLLYAVVARIAALNSRIARQLVFRWRVENSPVHIRLWAAAARHPELASAEMVAAFLLELDDRIFWDLNSFPEIAELRSERFGEMDARTQAEIVTRLRKLPPRNRWPKKAEAAKVRDARLYSAVRELNRIKVSGGELPQSVQSWLDAQLDQFARLRAMSGEEGFPTGPKSEWVVSNPDNRYDALEGESRLSALETALGNSRGGWADDPAERASAWLRRSEKTLQVLHDLTMVGDGGSNFPRVWNSFGWSHSPSGDAPRNLQSEANQVLVLLNRLPDDTLAAAIEGVSNWLDSWSTQVVASAMGLTVWLRVWPIAVKVTNETPELENEVGFSVAAHGTEDDHEPMDLDTLNTPAGKLVGVFLTACPRLNQGTHPFAAESRAGQMRDAVIGADGRSRLIVLRRLIEVLPYFLNADSIWTEQHLIAPLLSNADTSLSLWRAIARATRFTDVLRIIGPEMANKAIDRRLGRETRRGLTFSLVIESLHAFREAREPAVPNSRVQQMLRTLDDEVRAHAANAIQQFVRELSARPPHQIVLSAAELFRVAAAPFLSQVWPQERSLVTPGVSRALSDLPAASAEAFAEAVYSIERFLVPFDCWSMVDFGLYGDEWGIKKLSIIDDELKASALLHLLDLTVGTSEGAVVPSDLTDALDQIRSASPRLADAATYRRLATAARR